MGFKRSEADKSIESILERNRAKRVSTQVEAVNTQMESMEPVDLLEPVGFTGSQVEDFELEAAKLLEPSEPTLNATPRQKKVKEVTKSFNFTMRPSVRQKLNDLVDYDIEAKADSAASYLSEMVEKRHAELGLGR